MSGAWLPWLWGSEEEVSRAILHQGPHCRFLAETESKQTWGFSYMLATASGPGRPGLHYQSKGQDQVRSHTGREPPPPKYPVYQPQRTCSPES